MTRVKSKAATKHRKIRDKAKGFRQARRRRVKSGIEAVMHAGKYAYIGRRLKRRDLRSLWITRLNIAAHDNGVKYSWIISKMKENKVDLDRKILADIAFKMPDLFSKLIETLK